jgi:hypothetical protein
MLRRTAIVLAIPTLLLTVAQISGGASDEAESGGPTVSCGSAVTTVPNPDAKTTGKVLVAPDFQELDAQPGNPTTRCLTIENRTGHDIETTLKVRNIYAASDPGDGLKLTSKHVKYGAADWTILSSDRVKLIKGDTASVPFTVTPPDDIESGSHHSAVVVKYRRADSDDKTKSQISTIVVNVPGHVEKDGKVLSAHMPRLVLHGNRVHIDAIYRNTGDAIDLVDSQVTLTPMFGIGHKRVLTDRDRLVLRSSVQKVSVTWKVTPWFGRVTPKVKVESESTSRTFTLPAVLILPSIPFLAFGLILIGALGYVFWWYQRQAGWRAYYDEELQTEDEDTWES